MSLASRDALRSNAMIPYVNNPSSTPSSQAGAHGREGGKAAVAQVVTHVRGDAACRAGAEVQHARRAVDEHDAERDEGRERSPVAAPSSTKRSATSLKSAVASVLTRRTCEPQVRVGRCFVPRAPPGPPRRREHSVAIAQLPAMSGLRDHRPRTVRGVSDFLTCGRGREANRKTLIPPTNGMPIDSSGVGSPTTSMSGNA